MVRKGEDAGAQMDWILKGREWRLRSRGQGDWLEGG